jgi:hypothetical protein
MAESGYRLLVNCNPRQQGQEVFHLHAASAGADANWARCCFVEDLREKPMRAVGSSLPRIDALEKVTGSPVYLRRVRSCPSRPGSTSSLQGSRRADPGAGCECRHAPRQVLVTVLTAADVPVNEYGLIMADQPVLLGWAAPYRQAGCAGRLTMSPSSWPRAKLKPKLHPKIVNRL